MYHPTLEEVERLASQGNLVPVYREISADLETPVSAYLKVARPPYSFLLESVEGGERIGRYSFIGTEPYDVIKTGQGQPQGAVDPLKPVEAALSRFKLVRVPHLQRFNGGAVGYLGYEAARYFERLPSPDADLLGLPEAVWMLTHTYLVFDHVRHRIRVVSHAHLDGDVERAYADAVARIDELVRRLDSPARMPAGARPLPPEKRPPLGSNFTRQEYEAVVERVKRYVYAGDIIQSVPSQRLSRPTTAHPFQIYRSLRAINPSPYMYYLEVDGFQLVGTSPELPK
jgi:anthranilate synthase component 1